MTMCFCRHCLVEIQQVYFALILKIQSLGVISQECSVSLGIHVSHHAVGMSFRFTTPQFCGVLAAKVCRTSFPDKSPSQPASLCTFPPLHDHRRPDRCISSDFSECHSSRKDLVGAACPYLTPKPKEDPFQVILDQKGMW